MKCGFHIITISTDEELFPLQDMIYEHTPGGPSINITSANEHVPDIETQIIFVKDKTRAVRHSIHFNKIHKILIIYIVFTVVSMINYFPVNGEVSSILSPKTIFSGEIIHY